MTTTWVESETELEGGDPKFESCPTPGFVESPTEQRGHNFHDAESGNAESEVVMIKNIDTTLETSISYY